MGFPFAYMTEHSEAVLPRILDREPQCSTKSRTPRDPFQRCLPPCPGVFLPPSFSSFPGQHQKVQVVNILRSSEDRVAVTTEHLRWKGDGVCSLTLPHSRSWAAAASDQGRGLPLIVMLCDVYEVSSLHPHPTQIRVGPLPPVSLCLLSAWLSCMVTAVVPNKLNGIRGAP